MKKIEVNLGIGMNMFFPEPVIIEIPNDEIFVEDYLSYEKYLDFCKINSYPTLDDNWFSRKFKKYAPRNISEGQPLKGGHQKTWKGIKFRNDAMKEPDSEQKGLEC